MKRRGSNQNRAPNSSRNRGGGHNKRGRNQIRNGKVQHKNDKLYSEKMGRQLQPDEVAVLAREVERLSEKEKDLLEREKRLKSWEEKAKNDAQSASEKNAISRGQQLWKKAQKGMKGVTLSEKLRNAEKSIAILAARLEKAGLSTDVQGSEMSNNKELAKLREENEALAMKLQLANGRSAGANPAKKAAAAADKRARDLKAALDTLKEEYVKLKKELELSGSAGTSARQEVQKWKEKCKQQEELILGMQNKLKNNDKILAEKKAASELKSISEKMQKLLEEKNSLKERLKGAETDAASLRHQLEEHRSKLKSLSLQRKNSSEDNKKLKKLDEHFQNEKNKVKELNEKLNEVNDRVTRLSELQEKLKQKEIELNKERLEKESLLNKLKRQKDRVNGLEEDLKSAELEKETMREATRSTADAAAVSIESVQQVVKSLQEEIKILRQENEELKLGLETKENEVKKQIDEINDLKLASTEHQDFNNQSLQLHAQIQGLKKTVAEKNATIEQMEEIHTNEMEELRLQLQAEIDALKESFNQEKQNLITVTDEQIKQMRDKVNDIVQSQSDSESDVEEKNSEIEHLRLNNSELTSKLSSAETKNMTLTNDLKEQNKLVLESKEYVSNLRKDIKELNEQLKIKEVTHNASVETLKNYRKEINAKDTEIHRKNEQLKLLENDFQKLKIAKEKDQKKFQTVVQDQNDQFKKNENSLRQDIELLSEQLSSLIENGEEFKRNVYKRENQYKKQIEELQNTRKQDIAEFSKVRKAATAWKKKAGKIKKGSSASLSNENQINYKKPSTAGPKSSTVKDRKTNINKSKNNNSNNTNSKVFSRGRDINSQRRQEQLFNNNNNDSVPKLPSLNEKHSPIMTGKMNMIYEHEIIDENNNNNLSDGLILGEIEDNAIHHKVSRRAQQYAPHTPPRMKSNNEKSGFEPS